MRRDRGDTELDVAAPNLRSVPQGEGGPGPDTPDAELLALVAGHDRYAFELLYHRYVRSVFGAALRRLRDRGNAEEAVQVVFAAIWRSAASYRPELGPAGGWLYAVARDTVVDRFPSGGDPVAEAPGLVSDEPGRADRAESAYVPWRVHRALEELPKREREVLELGYWSGMSQSELAEYLHLPLGTVKGRTRSALARLSTLLEREFR